MYLIKELAQPWINLFRLLLVAAIVLTPILPTPEVQATQFVSQQITHSGYSPGDELLERRTASSKTWWLGGTVYKVTSYLGAIHYKETPQSPWLDIDTTMSPTGTVDKAPYVLNTYLTGNPGFRVSFRDSGEFDVRLKEARASDTDITKVLPSTKVTPKIQGSSVTWTDYFPGVDVILKAGKDKVTLQRVIKDGLAPREYDVSITEIVKGSAKLSPLPPARDATGQSVLMSEKPTVDGRTETLKLQVLSPDATVINYPIFDQTTVSVNASEDDCAVKYTGSAWSLDLTGTQWAGWASTSSYAMGGGMVFRGATIPSGATILTGNFTTICNYATNGVTVLTRIVGELSATPAAFSTIANYQGRRGTVVGGANNNNITSHNVTWDSIPAWTLGTAYTSPSIVTVLQDIANLGAITDIALYWDDHDDRSSGVSKAYRQGAPWDDTTYDPSYISFTYSGGGASAPTVVTNATSPFYATNATMSANITATNGANCTAEGFQWGTNSGNYTANSTATGNYGVSQFTYVPTLASATLWYNRGYAKNTGGTGYGAEVNFLTLPVAPTSLTPTPGNEQIAFTWTKATSGNNTTISTMLRYSDTSYPTTNSTGSLGVDWTTNSSGTISSLTDGTLYYISAFSKAVNGALTTYSTAYATTTSTPVAVPTVTTFAASNVEATTATLSGNITSIGGATVDLRGICYSSTNPPTVADNKTEESGSFGVGTFSGNLTGLITNHLYYARAYAHNSVGYAYGEVVTMQTKFTVGPGATNRTDDHASARTLIDLANPVSTNGTVDRVELWFNTNVTDVVVGMFFQISGYTYQCRSIATIGSVTAGSLQSFSGLNLSTVIGDVIGVFYDSGKIEVDLTGGAGYLYKASNHAIVGNQATYDLLSGGVVSIYGVGLSSFNTPTVTTSATTNITATTATANANITATGGVNATKRGIAYSSVNAFPDITDSTVEQSGSFGVGAFSANLTGLTSGVTYYIRGYAYNVIGYAYASNVDTIVTTSTAATVTSDNSTAVGETTVTLNATITDIGSSNVTLRGFEWGTTTSVYTNNSTTNGSYGIGAYSANITGLSKGTLYFWRAVVQNAGGTGYGSELTFLTIPDAPSGLSATPADTVLIMSWTPATGTGVTISTMVRYTDNGTYPADNVSGTLGIDWTTLTSGNITSLTNGTTYYISAISMAVGGGYVQYSIAYITTTGTPAEGPVVTVSTATLIEATTATLNGNVVSTGGANPTVTVYWGTSDGGTTWSSWSNNSSPTSPSQPQGVASFYLEVTSLSTGTTWYFSASANNTVGTGWATTLSFLTKPAAPTGVSATDGSSTANVTVTFTKSTGATNYTIWRDSDNLTAVGDVATYTDTTASAPTITPGTASASDGTSTLHVTLSLSGHSANNGTTYAYRVQAWNATGLSANSTADNGYRGVGSLTYQWQRSAADSDASYSNISGATTTPYNDTGAPADGSGRYFLCILDATGAIQQTSTSDRGYRSPPGTELLPPTGLTITDLGGNTLSVTWTLGLNSIYTSLRLSRSDYPASNVSGEWLYFGSGTSANITGWASDVTPAYISAWGVASDNNTFSATYAEATIGGDGMTEIGTQLGNLKDTVLFLGSMMPLVLLSILAFWRPNGVLFCILAGVAIMSALALYDEIGTNLALGGSLGLLLYAFYCIAMAYKTMFGGERKQT